MNNFRREFQFLGDLVPHRHQPHRAPILEAKPPASDALVDKGGHLPPDLAYAGVGPPGYRQLEIITGIDAEQGQEAVVQSGNFGPLPGFPSAIAHRLAGLGSRRAIRHLNAERAQHPRAQGNPAALRAKHDDEGAPLPCCGRAGPDLPDHARRCRHTVVHAKSPVYWAP
jgi:hypothetical protein